MPGFESIWGQITEVAKVNNVSVEEILGIMTVHAGSAATSGKNTADAIGKTGATLLDDVILNDYRETLNGLQKQGLVNFLESNMKPFVENAQSHFDFNSVTLTQKLLNRFSIKFRRLTDSVRQIQR